MKKPPAPRSVLITVDDVGYHFDISPGMSLEALMGIIESARALLRADAITRYTPKWPAGEQGAEKGKEKP